MVALGFIFRMREMAVSGYANMNPESNEEVEFALSDIASLNVHSAELNRGGRKWEEGMPLPGMPSIVETNDRKPEQKEEVVVLASPDGTSTINAQVTEDNEV